MSFIPPNLMHGAALDGDRVQTMFMKYGLGSAKAYVVAFFDNSSTCSVVRNEFALKNKLYGKEVMISLATVNGTKDLTTKLYLMELIDMDWNTQVVRAFSLNNICGLLLNVRYEVFKIRGNMLAKRSRFGGSLVLNS